MFQGSSGDCATWLSLAEVDTLGEETNPDSSAWREPDEEARRGGGATPTEGGRKAARGLGPGLQHGAVMSLHISLFCYDGGDSLRSRLDPAVMHHT